MLDTVCFGNIFCQFVLFLWCFLSSGEEKEQLEHLMESVEFEKEEFLQCMSINYYLSIITID